MEPQTRLGVAALTKMAYDGQDLMPLREELLSLCKNNSASAANLMDLSVIEQLHGNLDEGLQIQSIALNSCSLFRTYSSQTPKKTLLVYAASVHMGGNTPVEFLLPNEKIEIITYYPQASGSDGPLPTLPDHDVAFCAAPADDEGAQSFLEEVRTISKNSAAKVLNLPDILVKPERDTLPDLLDGISGLRLPKTMRVTAQELQETLKNSQELTQLNPIGNYPYVVRPVGSHAGKGLAKINSRDEFVAYLAAQNDDDFFVSEFINYVSKRDESFRKYRIVLIDGKPFPCHMAISDQWDVWYMNSNMRLSEEKRREEASFMDHFVADFGKRHNKAFELLTESLGLDYFGLDCAEDQEGNLVIFEVDNALIVHDMDCPETFPYKKKHMHRIFGAFEKMLLRSCPDFTTGKLSNSASYNLTQQNKCDADAA